MNYSPLGPFNSSPSSPIIDHNHHHHPPPPPPHHPQLHQHHHHHNFHQLPPPQLHHPHHNYYHNNHNHIQTTPTPTPPPPFFYHPLPPPTQVNFTNTTPPLPSTPISSRNNTPTLKYPDQPEFHTSSSDPHFQNLNLQQPSSSSSSSTTTDHIYHFESSSSSNLINSITTSPLGSPISTPSSSAAASSSSSSSSSSFKILSSGCIDHTSSSSSRSNSMLPTSNTTSSSQQQSSQTSSTPSQHLSSDLTHLPLPSIFQQNQNASASMNPPPILFSPSASLTSTPTFLLPTQSSLLSHTNMFPQDQQYMGMDVGDQFQMHNQHYSAPYPYLYLQQTTAQQVAQQHQAQQAHQHAAQQAQQAAQQQQQQQPHHQSNLSSSSSSSSIHGSPTASAPKIKRKSSSEKKHTDTNGSPMVIPKCTRCNESASWRHDKRRWWCKECKKAFTPGITKSSGSSPSPQQIHQSPIPMSSGSPLPHWDPQLPNSIQNTPPTAPQNPNMVTPAQAICPTCNNPGGWKHDKKRWHCKTCKKPFTPATIHDGGISGIPSSPTSPNKKKSTKPKRSPTPTSSITSPPSSISSPNPLFPLIATNSMLPQNLSYGSMQGMPHIFMPPISPANIKHDVLRNSSTSPTPNTPPSIPSPTILMSGHSNIPNPLIPGPSNLSPNGTPKKSKLKKEKEMEGVQVLVSCVDNTLSSDVNRSNNSNNETDWKMNSGAGQQQKLFSSLSNDQKFPLTS